MYYILVTYYITVNGRKNTDIAFKNCAPFSTCKTEMNDVFVGKADHIYITMSMYNMIEYSDNYSDTSESLWQFKRDELPKTDADLTVNGCKTFKYKALS